VRLAITRVSSDLSGLAVDPRLLFCLAVLCANDTSPTVSGRDLRTDRRFGVDETSDDPAVSGYTEEHESSYVNQN
jgi:hypothetical protein